MESLSPVSESISVWASSACKRPLPAHDNLQAIMGKEFTKGGSWEFSVSAFETLLGASLQSQHSPAVMVAIPLVDSADDATDHLDFLRVPAWGEIGELHPLSPPYLALLQNAATPLNRCERYSLSLDISVNIRFANWGPGVEIFYEARRTLEESYEGDVWGRFVVLRSHPHLLGNQI